MSISVVKRLLKIDLPHTEKSIATVFSTHLSEKFPEHGAWVGVPTIARETGLSESSVEKGLSALRRKSILIRQGYRTGVKCQMPIYTVHPEHGKLLEPVPSTDSEPIHITDSRLEPVNENEEPINAEEEPILADREPVTNMDNQDRTSLNKKRENKAKPNSHVPPRERATILKEFLIWLVNTYKGLNFTSKEKATIRRVILHSDFILPELQAAAESCLEGLDPKNSFDHASNKLAENLEIQAEASRVLAKQHEQTDAMKASLMVSERQKALAELEEAEKLAQQESELVEDTLG
jgi:hypothetical protein